MQIAHTVTVHTTVPQGPIQELNLGPSFCEATAPLEALCRLSTIINVD